MSHQTVSFLVRKYGLHALQKRSRFLSHSKGQLTSNLHAKASDLCLQDQYPPTQSPNQASTDASPAQLLPSLLHKALASSIRHHIAKINASKCIMIPLRVSPSPSSLSALGGNKRVRESAFVE